MTALSSVEKNASGKYLVTANDIDLVVQQWAEVISEAINDL